MNPQGHGRVVPGRAPLTHGHPPCRVSARCRAGQGHRPPHGGACHCDHTARWAPQGAWPGGAVALGRSLGRGEGGRAPRPLHDRLPLSTSVLSPSKADSSARTPTRLPGFCLLWPRLDRGRAERAHCRRALPSPPHPPARPGSGAGRARGVMGAEGPEGAAVRPGVPSGIAPIPAAGSRSFQDTEPQSSHAGRVGTWPHLMTLGMVPSCLHRGSACAWSSISPKAPTPGSVVLRSLRARDPDPWRPQGQQTLTLCPHAVAGALLPCHSGPGIF